MASKPLHVLIVEDSEDDTLFLVRQLRRARYAPTYRRVETPQAMREALNEVRWDVVTCDSSMPEFSVTAALQILDEFDRDTPLIIVSGKIDDVKAASMMKAGAHDYVPKDKLLLLAPAIERELREAELRRERREIEWKLRESEARFQSVAQHIPGIIYQRLRHPDGRLSYPFVSGRVREFYGYEPEQVVSGELLLSDAALPEDRPMLLASIEESAREMTAWRHEYRTCDRDGRVRWVQGISQPRPAEGGGVIWDGILLDITEHRQAEERLAYVTNFDPLTGHANRILMMDRLAQAIATAKRNEHMLAVLAISIGQIKAINETLGYEVGNAVIRAAAERLTEAIGERGTVARAGGAGFTILLSEIEDVEAVTVTIQTVFAGLRPPVIVEDQSFYISANVGIAVYPNDESSPEALVRAAEAALHRARAEGSNNYRFFTEDINTRALVRLSIENRLRRALDRDEFIVHYQPILDAHSAVLHGVEALVRWQTDADQILQPGEFIGIAEESGLILPIGERVLALACAQMRMWDDSEMPPLLLAVNVSAKQFGDPRLISSVESCLTDSGLPPDRLTLELTESALMANREQAKKLMDEVHAMGVRLAIDDFGTGYSSLSYLSRFPIDTLKIDRAFVGTMNSDPVNATIVDAIVSLAHSLKMQVTAEGVETQEQVTVLKAFGCDMMQGYLFSPPVSPGQLVEYVRSRS